MMFKRDGNLQNMCLNVVVDKINIFREPTDAMKIYIEFLRRCYSDQLFELIEKRQNSKELVWLISPYWKNVSLPGAGYRFSDVLSKMKCVGDKITSLNLKDSACSSDTLSAIICCLPNLITLNLSGTSFKDDALLLIRKMCPNLHTLDLSNCTCLTDKGLKNMTFFNDDYRDYPSLKVLDLTNTFIQISTLYHIVQNFKSLEVLSHRYFLTVLKFTYSGHADEIIPKYNFTYFEYRIAQIPISNELDSILEDILRICPFINHIFIQGKIFKDTLQLLTKCECLKKLKLLSIVNSKRNAPQTSPLLKIKGAMLTHLEIFQLPVCAAMVCCACPNLEYLLLCGVEYQDFMPAGPNNPIPELKNLRTLVIKHVYLDCRVPFKSISLLISSSENLNDLTIQYAKPFTDTVADVILKLPNLSTVDFSFTDISPETLLRFFTHPCVSKICTDMCPRISLNKNTSCISKLISPHCGTTCAWEINYSEPIKRH